MNDLIGFTSIGLVTLITVFIGLRWPAISNIIRTALLVRIFFILIGYYFFILPDSDQDALGLDDIAWSLAQDGFLNVINNFPGLNSFFYTWLIAIPYSLFGRSILMSQSLSLFFGLGVVFLGWLFAKKLWGSHTAAKVGWVLALFPSLVLYSILPLRDVYSSFFLLVGMFGLYNWTRTDSFGSSMLTIFGFFASAFFHGALIVGGIFFILILFITSLKKASVLLINKRINIKVIFILFFILVVLQKIISNQIYLPKLGYFNDLSLGLIVSELNTRVIGTGAYSEWTKINSFGEFFYKIPLRVLLFLFSPLPWEVKKLSHLIGMFDGLFYIIIVYLIFCNRKIIWNDPSLRMLTIFLIGYLIMFGVGVGNFGAGLRHRSKFVIEMVLLAGPLLPIISFQKKK